MQTLTLAMTALLITALIVFCGIAMGFLSESASSGDVQTETPKASLSEEWSGTVLAVDGVATLCEDELSLIAHLISEEAGEYPYETQVCFAAMILNRMEDSGFPSTARGVILECGDFPSVNAGRVTGTLPTGYTARRRYRVALRALGEALDGRDPTEGALYCSKEFDPTLSYECGGMYFGT